MKHTQVIDKLDVALLEVERYGIFLCGEVQGVEGFGLGGGDGWNGRGAWEGLESRKGTACILDDETEMGSWGCRGEVKKWPRRVGFAGVSETKGIRMLGWVFGVVKKGTLHFGDPGFG